MSSYIVYTDGGARGNPGPAAAAAVLLRQVESHPVIRPGAPSDDGAKSVTSESSERSIKKYIGEATNNVAEYSAVIMGLEEALKLGAEEVELRLDSELVGKQLRGEYKVKDKNMQSLFVKAWNLKTRLKKFVVTIIPREQNQEADRLVNEVLDDQLKAQ